MVGVKNGLFSAGQRAISLWTAISAHVIPPDVFAASGEVVSHTRLIEVNTRQCNADLTPGVGGDNPIRRDNAAVADEHPWTPCFAGVNAEADRHMNNPVVNSRA